MERERILVLGAGITGLTTAVVLAERGHPVRVVSRERPRDTTSAVPAAFWFPLLAEPRERVKGWGRRSWERFRDLSREAATGVRELEAVVVAHEAGDPWWKDTVPGRWRPASPGELPPGVAAAHVLTTYVVETPRYLPWLEERLTTLGGRLELAEVDHLAELSGPDVVLVNATGLGARDLARDPGVIPVRGHVVFLDPVPLSHLVLDTAGPERVSYVVPRGDAVVVGTSVEPGTTSLEPDPRVVEDILARGRALVPELEKVPVRRVGVGLRPCRSEVRLEPGRVAGGPVVHSYGQGGAGFTLSWGAAEEAADLVERALG